MAGGVRQPRTLAAKVDNQREACAGRVRQADEAKAAHLDQASDFGGRGGHSIDDLHPIVRDEGETVIEKAEQKIRLAASRRPHQKHACAAAGGTARMDLHRPNVGQGSPERKQVVAK